MGEERGYRDFGRDAALDALAGDGGLLVLGPAGCGRSTLLTEIAAHEHDRDRRVWWCRGHQVGHPSGDEVLWSGAVEAVLRAAGTEPTTVLVDDAHLLGDAVAERLVALAERRRDLDLRLVAARRPVRPGATLARLDTSLVGPDGALHLGPLGVAGVGGWLAGLGHDAANAAAVVARTGGWPELVAADLDSSGTGTADLVAARVALLDASHQLVLRAVSFGLPAGSRTLAEATAASHGEVDAAAEAARAAGLVHEATGPVPAVAAVLRATTPVDERARIASATLGVGPPDVVVAVARHLAADGDRSVEAGLLFERAADQLLSPPSPAGPTGPTGPTALAEGGSPDEAARLLEAALRAGRPAEALVPRRAAAALAAGRAEEAAALAIRAASPPTTTPSEDGDGTDQARLRRVAGGAWAHLASPGLAADCLLATDDDRVLAVVPLLAAGRADEAGELLSGPSPLAPSAAHALAEGAAAWMTGDNDRAVVALERSAQLAQVCGGVEDWPDSPHAILTLAAAQWLDSGRAERVAGTAVERHVGGRPFDGRHRLLLAWTALRAGRLDEASAALAVVPEPPPEMIRDAVVAAALAAAIALRTGEPAQLPQVHAAAATTVARGAPDPFAPDLAGELAHLAARVGADPEPILGPLERLADALGSPVTMAVPLAWARLMVAVASDDASAARAAARRLAEGADQHPPERGAAGGPSPEREAVTLFADAAHAFADVLGGRVDAGAVQAVAGRLVERGLVFEASRLVGAASLRCDDAAATRGLLAELRRLRTTQARTGPRPGPVAELSEREREVARAVLEGHTHREIGAQLYISAKTVEHHVARIRQKLGATTTRADLLAAIRDELDRVNQRTG